MTPWSRRRSGLVWTRRTASPSPTRPMMSTIRGAALPHGRVCRSVPNTRLASPPRARPTTIADPGATTVRPTPEQISAMIAGAREGDVGELTRLVSRGVPANVRDVNGFTPLMAAVVNDRVPAARALLERGAEINARTRGGITSLMLGIINDRPDAVKLLLERGADVNAQSGSGWTALSFAVWRGDDALVRVLLDHGAKPNLVDKQGWTPLDYATAKDAASDAGER